MSRCTMLMLSMLATIWKNHSGFGTYGTVTYQDTVLHTSLYVAENNYWPFFLTNPRFGGFTTTLLRNVVFV